MTDLDDFDLGADENGPAAHRGRPGGFPAALVAAAVGLVGLIGVVGYVAVRRPAPPSPTPPAAPSVSPTPSATVAPLPSGLPALNGSDTFVRDLVKGLSSHPQLAAWLAAHDLVRTLTVAVENVAAGQTPRAHLAFLAPKEMFAVVPKQGRLAIDPRSYARYDDLADGFASLDAKGCADAFGRLEPLFDAAYRDLGYPEGGFRSVVARAVAMLEATPVVDGDIFVKPAARATLVYEYEDRRLEGLTAAQRQLLRLGPRNVRKVQAKLHELAAALDLTRATPGPPS